MDLLQRRDQLKERDVRQGAPLLDPKAFLRAYSESNFPQTVAYPSKMQLEGRVPAMQTQLKFDKPKIPSGIAYDRPEVT